MSVIINFGIFLGGEKYFKRLSAAQNSAEWFSWLQTIVRNTGYRQSTADCRQSSEILAIVRVQLIANNRPKYWLSSEYSWLQTIVRNTGYRQSTAKGIKIHQLKPFFKNTFTVGNAACFGRFIKITIWHRLRINMGWTHIQYIG